MRSENFIIKSDRCIGSVKGFVESADTKIFCCTYKLELHNIVEGEFLMLNIPCTNPLLEVNQYISKIICTLLLCCVFSQAHKLDEALSHYFGPAQSYDSSSSSGDSSGDIT